MKSEEIEGPDEIVMKRFEFPANEAELLKYMEFSLNQICRRFQVNIRKARADARTGFNRNDRQEN